MNSEVEAITPSSPEDEAPASTTPATPEESGSSEVAAEALSEPTSIDDASDADEVPSFEDPVSDASSADEADGNAALPAPTRRLLRGMEAARRIEDSSAQLRKLRRHCKGAPKTRSRTRARSHLRSLIATLEVLQRGAISEGLSGSEWRGLKGRLEELDAFTEEQLGHSLKKRHLKRIRAYARSSARVLARA